MKQAEEYYEQTFINIKIQTLNKTIYEIIANPARSIRHLQNQIEQKTKVPFQAQRILYRNQVLDLDKTLADYHIEEGNIIQLIANKIPSQQSNPSSLPRTELQKANNYGREHNKTKKFRQLQERINGFRIKKQESLQVLQQNKHTIDQLIECLNMNFMQDVSPFKIQKRKLQVGEWIDIKDSSGQWIQGQVINQYAEYAQIHYNGFDDKWNEWISTNSERIMPLRTHTVQMLHKSPYMSPFPTYEKRIPTKKNVQFHTNIETMIYQLTNTLDNLNSLMKELQFTRKQQSKDESLKNVSNISIPQLLVSGQKQQSYNQQMHQGQKPEQFDTPNKQNQMLGDNLSNKCQDDRSNHCDNDDISNKSYTSKRSEGLVDTASMKSLIIDESRKRNKVFFDRTEEAQSVRSVKHKKSNKNLNAYNQQYILQQDSQYNQQEFQDFSIIRKKQLKRKMKASQLAPLLDRMGRFLIDIAPHFAQLGHPDQTSNINYNENLSTYTNEGSLLSKMSQMNKITTSNNLFHSSSMNNQMQIANNNEINQEERAVNSFCSFQIPIMLSPSELLKLQKLIETQKRNLQIL